MHYVIQENIFREQHYDMLKKSLDRMELSYDIVRIFPFVNKIVNIKDIPEGEDGYNYIVDELPEYDPGRKDVFVFGAIKLARISKEKDWIPGSMMNENHDYLVYEKFYGDNLLNHDSVITTVASSSDLKWHVGEQKFIRPTKDTKSFTGALYFEEEWHDFVEHYLHNFKSEIFNADTKIQVSTPKDIQKEIRFWVVGGKVITGSQYRLGNQVLYDEYYEEEAKQFAQQMVDKFQLAEAFVIDVCLTSDKWKIVECGCINAAGFYKADLQKVLNAVEEHFSPIVEFNCYGVTIIGTFISEKEGKISIKVISDSSNVYKPEEIHSIHKSHLIK